jgi:hypothetical protein
MSLPPLFSLYSIKKMIFPPLNMTKKKVEHILILSFFLLNIYITHIRLSYFRVAFLHNEPRKSSNHTSTREGW